MNAVANSSGKWVPGTACALKENTYWTRKQAETGSCNQKPWGAQSADSEDRNEMGSPKIAVGGLADIAPQKMLQQFAYRVPGSCGVSSAKSSQSSLVLQRAATRLSQATALGSPAAPAAGCSAVDDDGRALLSDSPIQRSSGFPSSLAVSPNSSRSWRSLDPVAILRPTSPAAGAESNALVNVGAV